MSFFNLFLNVISVSVYPVLFDKNMSDSSVSWIGLGISLLLIVDKLVSKSKKIKCKCCGCSEFEAESEISLSPSKPSKKSTTATNDKNVVFINKSDQNENEV